MAKLAVPDARIPEMTQRLSTDRGAGEFRCRPTQYDTQLKRDRVVATPTSTTPVYCTQLWRDAALQHFYERSKLRIRLLAPTYDSTGHIGNSCTLRVGGSVFKI